MTTQIEILKTQRSKLMLFVSILLVFGSGLACAADPIKGGELYKMYCASCHGASGTSVMPNAPNFSRNEKMMRPDMMILTSIKNGKNACPAFQGVLSDRDILNVISYMRTLN